MSRDLTPCLFASSPITDCGRDIVVPASVLASSWPLAFIGLAILAFAGWTFLRAIYPRRINWDRDPGPAWDTGDDDRPTIEIRARRAGE